jgi:hypothetical protein
LLRADFVHGSEIYYSEDKSFPKEAIYTMYRKTVIHANHNSFSFLVNLSPPANPQFSFSRENLTAARLV